MPTARSRSRTAVSRSCGRGATFRSRRASRLTDCVECGLEHAHVVAVGAVDRPAPLGCHGAQTRPLPAQLGPIGGVGGRCPHRRRGLVQRPVYCDVVKVEAHDPVEHGEGFDLDLLEHPGVDPLVPAGAQGGVGHLVVEDRFDIDPEKAPVTSRIKIPRKAELVRYETGPTQRPVDGHLPASRTDRSGGRRARSRVDRRIPAASCSSLRSRSDSSSGSAAGWPSLGPAPTAPARRSSHSALLADAIPWRESLTGSGTRATSPSSCPADRSPTDPQPIRSVRWSRLTERQTPTPSRRAPRS